MSISQEEYDAILRHDPEAFIERCFRELNQSAEYQPNWHISVIGEKLRDVKDGKIKRLIINVPPRSLKSIAITIAFSAWMHGHFPEKDIISVSYSQDLSTKFARDVRAIMETAWYKRVFPTQLIKQRSVDDIATTAGGTRLATSVGGTLTGRGADIIIIDDPLKPEDALSEARRSSANDWYENTLRSRLNNKVDGVIILVMQRLHQEDLVGHLLSKETWNLVSLQAIATENETYMIQSLGQTRRFERAVGEALHPAREPISVLRQLRASMGEYHFTSQYQQNPIPKDGVMVKAHWLRYYDDETAPSRFQWTIQSWDTANKTGELNDFSVCTTWGVHGQNYYLIDVFRERLDYPNLKRAIIRLARLHNAQSVVIEDKASGTQVIQDLTESGLVSVKPYEPPSGTDKTMRLHLQTAIIESGRVFLPKSAPWLADYVSELVSFPGGKYDDQVDSTTQALAFLSVPSMAVKLIRAFGSG